MVCIKKGDNNKMNILITGTSRGIGKAIAQKFLDKGHNVVGIDICESAISDNRYTHIKADILADSLPDIDDVEILINNAGVQNSGRDIDINLKGTIKVCEKYAMHSNIKSVLFIASASAQTGAEFAEYAASKGGIVAYMKNTALQLAQYGATVNSLSPGGVINELNEHIINDPELYRQVLDEALLSKWATNEEIAEWAYFVTVINKSMTAQDILIDNGEAAKSNFIW